jgi:hypothetical protein
MHRTTDANSYPKTYRRLQVRAAVGAAAGPRTSAIVRRGGVECRRQCWIVRRKIVRTIAKEETSTHVHLLHARRPPEQRIFSCSQRLARARATRFGVNRASNLEDSCYLPVFKRRAARGGHRERAAPSVTSDSGRRNRSARRFSAKLDCPSRTSSIALCNRRWWVIGCRYKHRHGPRPSKPDERKREYANTEQVLQEVGRSDAVPTSPLARLLRSGSTIPRHGR